MQHLNPHKYKYRDFAKFQSPTHSDAADVAAEHIWIRNINQSNASSTFYSLSISPPDWMSAITATSSFSADQFNTELLLKAWTNVTANPQPIISQQKLEAKEQPVRSQISDVLTRWRLQSLTRKLVETSDKVSTDDLAKIIALIRGILSAHEYLLFDALLTSIDIKQLSTVTIVALLRSSFPYRRFIGEWRSILGKSHTELISRNLDASKLLRGLTG
jgi:hypothetical protein